MEKTERQGIHAGILRVIALVLMLLDHAWATIIPGNDWMTWLGRMAFPIFAFQLVEGFFNTSNVNRYIKRLLIFAVISEIPLNLIYGGSAFYPFHQNVMFNLLFGLLTIRSLEKVKVQLQGLKDSGLEGGAGFWAYTKKILCAVLVVGSYCILATITFTDYVHRGVLTVVMFYLVRSVPYAKMWQLAGMVFINIIMITGQLIPFTVVGKEFYFPVQGFAVFSLLFIWAYNGRKGWKSKAFRYFSYVFYPVHALVLYFVWILL